MAYQRYTTTTILSMVEEMEPTRGFWTSLAFGNAVHFDTDTIEFDIRLGGKRVAPFVHPLSAAPTMQRRGFVTKNMKPAYVKMKDFVAPTDVLMRGAGEGYNNQQLSPQERMDRLMAQQLAEHDEMLSNRIEWMAAKAILDGKYTVTGDGYPTTVVDFDHPAVLNVALAGAATWNNNTSSPIDDLENLAVSIRKESFGAVADTVVMHTSAWQYFRKHSDVKDRMSTLIDTVNKTHLDIGVQLDPVGTNYVGKLDGKLDVFVYDDWLNDDDGNNVQIMPVNTVVVMSRRALEGSQYYGAILDSQAGFQPLRMYSKSRSSFDPSGEELLSQSAPLVAPKRANTWGILNVA